MCDFVDCIKLAQQKFYKLYCDSYVKFENPSFDNFNSIEALTNENFCLSWFFDMNGVKTQLNG